MIFISLLVIFGGIFWIIEDSNDRPLEKPMRKPDKDKYKWLKDKF